MKNMKKSIIVITAIMAISSGASANPFAKKSQPVDPAPVVEQVEQAPAVQAEPAKSQAVATVAAEPDGLPPPPFETPQQPMAATGGAGKGSSMPPEVAEQIAEAKRQQAASMAKLEELQRESARKQAELNKKYGLGGTSK